MFKTKFAETLLKECIRRAAVSNLACPFWIEKPMGECHAQCYGDAHKIGVVLEQSPGRDWQTHWMVMPRLFNLKQKHRGKFA